MLRAALRRLWLRRAGLARSWQLLVKLTEDLSPLALLWRKSADADRGKSLVGRLFLRVVYTVIVVFFAYTPPPVPGV